MTHDQNSEPTEHERSLPLQEGIAKVACRLLGNRADTEIERAIRNAVVGLAPVYVRPDRPIDITVSIDDEDGRECEQTTHLSRSESTVPWVVGASIGSAVAAVLTTYYAGQRDGLWLAEAQDAAVRELGGTSS